MPTSIATRISRGKLVQLSCGISFCLHYIHTLPHEKYLMTLHAIIWIQPTVSCSAVIIHCPLELYISTPLAHRRNSKQSVHTNKLHSGSLYVIGIMWSMDGIHVFWITTGCGDDLRLNCGTLCSFGTHKKISFVCYGWQTKDSCYEQHNGQWRAPETLDSIVFNVPSWHHNKTFSGWKKTLSWHTILVV